jgi:hypothetical protein
MIQAQNIIRFIILVVAIVHCVNIVDSSFNSYDRIEGTEIEFSDVDTNESESEESEDETKIVELFVDPNHQLYECFVLTSEYRNIFSDFQFKIKSSTLSVPYTPPELTV